MTAANTFGAKRLAPKFNFFSLPVFLKTAENKSFD